MKRLFAALALVFGAYFYGDGGSATVHAQTPHLNCDHAAGNSSAYVKSNEADDCIDAAMNDVDAITAFATDANDSLTAAQIRGGAWLTISSTATLTATRTLDLPDSIERRLVIKNSTTGSQDITISQNAGRTITIPNGGWADVQLDGTNVDEASIAISGTELVTADAGDRVPIFDDSAGLIKWIDGTSVGGGATAISAGPGSKSPLLHVREQPTDGTAGGASVAGRQVRVLDTTVTNEIDGASLGSNQITLPAGDYFIMARAPARQVGTHALRWQNTSGPTDVIIGTNAAATSSDSTITDAFLAGKFSIASQATFELEHYTNLVKSTDGLGVAVAESSIVEVYAEVWIWQIENITAQTTDATVTDILTIGLASGEVATIKVWIQALLSTGAEAYSAQIFQTCLNIAGTTSAGTEFSDESEVGTPDASLDASINCNDTDDRLDVEITGATSETWNWSMTYDVIKQ